MVEKSKVNVPFPRKIRPVAIGSRIEPGSREYSAICSLVNFTLKRAKFTTEETMKLRCFFPPPVPRHGEKDKRKMRRDAARLASSGNVLVQQGLFVTKEEIDRRKKRLLG
ncbi:MAG TPA: hypothetical protein ENK27_13565 [Desulfobulbus sp.]|nr:hypothetical protein [Desulfobulbus sp.]